MQIPITSPARRALLGGFAIAMILASCGQADDQTSAEATSDAQTSTGEQAVGIRLASPQDGAALQANPPDNLVILDVRTPEEFAEGHLEGAILIDFYEDNFADELAQLDPEVPYLLYCRSGNRSGQTAEMMGELGFNDVADVDGGILAWNEEGLPTVVE